MNARRALAVAVCATLGIVAVRAAARRRVAAPASPSVSISTFAVAPVPSVSATAPAQTEPLVTGFGVEGFDPLEQAKETWTDPTALVALVPMKTRDAVSLGIAKAIVGPGAHHGNLGNPAIARHRVSRAACLEGLKGEVIQTKEQRSICGAPWEVPVYADGDPSHAKVCIDQFEYPNRPCDLPMVFTHSIVAEKLCALDGKRLCTQEEWTLSCEADPKGGPPSAYAYGEQLDLHACNTGFPKSTTCDVDHGLFTTCPTESDPAGSHPRCRSRLGVYDQHGNVAEAMTRKEGKVTYVQLKGSAWFYDGKMYQDHCRFDPRWHVDPVDASWHTNYHLGFRCCRDLGGSASKKP